MRGRSSVWLPQVAYFLRMQTMHDRQKFELQTLANGIRLYTHRSPSPICHLEIILPVGAGHAHEANNILPGAPHFLEHAQLIRSNRYSNPYELDRLIGMRGGHSNGTTYPTSTHYKLDAPASHLDFAVEALLERTYSPIFDEADLKPERTVVMNERNARKFYPGRSLVSKFYHTEFMADAEYPLVQLFGSDENLNAMSPQILANMQSRISLNRDVRFLAVGPSDFSEFAEQLSHIQTVDERFELKVNGVHWADPQFRYCYFDTVSQPTLEVAWIHPRLDYATFRAASFLLSLLINSTHGALHTELREQKGWTYGLDGYCQQRPSNTLIGISFPVNTKEQIEYIRECLLERIVTASENQDLVEAEIGRYVHSQVYNFQTAGEIMGGAAYDLDTYGCIHSEEEWSAAVHAVADKAWRRSIVGKLFGPENQGSICLMPERRHKVLMRELPT